MRSQSKKTDFPEQVLDHQGGEERREQTNARLSANRKHIKTTFVGQHSRFLSFVEFGPYQDLSNAYAPGIGHGLGKLCDTVVLGEYNVANRVGVISVDRLRVLEGLQPPPPKIVFEANPVGAVISFGVEPLGKIPDRLVLTRGERLEITERHERRR